MGLAVTVITRSIPSGPRAGFASSISATVPDTCGIVMLVPLNVV